MPTLQSPVSELFCIPPRLKYVKKCFANSTESSDSRQKKKVVFFPINENYQNEWSTDDMLILVSRYIFLLLYIIPSKLFFKTSRPVIQRLRLHTKTHRPFTINRTCPLFFLNWRKLKIEQTFCFHWLPPTFLCPEMHTISRFVWRIFSSTWVFFFTKKRPFSYFSIFIFPYF